MIPSRNMTRGNEAVSELEMLTGKTGKSEAMELDLMSLMSVLKFAEEYKAKGYPLHGLINNGKAYKPQLLRSGLM